MLERNYPKIATLLFIVDLHEDEHQDSFKNSFDKCYNKLGQPKVLIYDNIQNIFAFIIPLENALT